MVRTLIFFFACSFSILLNAQDLTGVWRGSFYNEYEYLFTGAKYRYEVQIKTTGLQAKGVTYSYQNTRFYGKASMVGKWSPSTRDLTLVENKMLDLKIVGGGDGCLMTCYLQYRKDGDREFLEGTYSSVNMKNDTAQCGGGVVRLEKVVDSDFALEDFLKQDQKATNKGGVKPGQDEYLIKKPTPAPPKTNAAKTPAKPNSGSTAKTTPSKTPAPKTNSTPKTGTTSNPNTNNSSTAKTTTPKAATGKTQAVAGGTTVKTTPPKPTPSAAKPSTSTAKTTATVKPPVGPSKTSSGAVIGSGSNAAKTVPPATPAEPVKPPVATTTPQNTLPPAPAVIKNRKNELVETIATASRKLEISFYDNGEIDGDTISVYANNRLIVSRKGLSAEPITVTISLDETVENQEIVMVAENLGSIPPNTALMIVQAGAQRYAVRLSSNEQKNALVRFRYDPNALK